MVARVGWGEVRTPTLLRRWGLRWGEQRESQRTIECPMGVGYMRYRRADLAGGTYFFTVNLAERKRTLLVDHVDVLRAVIHNVNAMHPFRIDAMVILPDHLHGLWTLPVDDYDYPMRWTLIKTGFSRQYRKVSGATRASLPRASGASGNGAIGNT